MTKTARLAAIFISSFATSVAAGNLSAPELPSTGLVATNFVEDAGGSQRINLSGKLRMLSQRIPAAACNAHAGVAPDESSALLTSAVTEFNTILDALEFGNDDLGVYGAEERRRTVRVIEEVRRKLAPLLVALEDSHNGVPSADAVATLANGNMELLDIAKLLVSEESGEYANPVALRQSDAMAIDIAGRQRMLTQKMSKEICLALSGVNAAASLETLAGTMKMFEVSHFALRDGMESVGLTTPPTDEIADGLMKVQGHWTEIRGLIGVITKGGQVSAEDRTQIFIGLNTTMAEMNRVVGLYSAASKLGL